MSERLYKARLAAGRALELWRQKVELHALAVTRLLKGVYRGYPVPLAIFTILALLSLVIVHPGSLCWVTHGHVSFIILTVVLCAAITCLAFGVLRLALLQVDMHIEESLGEDNLNRLRRIRGREQMRDETDSRMMWGELRIIAVPYKHAFVVATVCVLAILALASMWTFALWSTAASSYSEHYGDTPPFAGVANSASVAEHFYYTMITFATIGYGDIHPNSGYGRWLAVVLSVVSFITVAFGLGAVVSGCFYALSKWDDELWELVTRAPMPAVI